MDNLTQEVNHPKHYCGHESKIEPICITRHLPGDLSNAWKYATRYEDKGVPKKDLMKLCWYLNDYVENFIGVNNYITYHFTVSEDVLELMRTVITFEPNETIKGIFKQILSIAENQKIVSMDDFNGAISKVKQLAEMYQQ